MPQLLLPVLRLHLIRERLYGAFFKGGIDIRKPGAQNVPAKEPTTITDKAKDAATA